MRNLAGAAAARWLKLSAEERERAGLMAPSHALRVEINGIIREQLAREGVVKGPALANERLVSLGYTRAELSLPENYAAGNVVGFNRTYKRLGVEKGDELRIAAKSGGVEVYKSDTIELREGDRIRWTRNDKGLGLVNSQTAEVSGVKDDTVTFRLAEGGHGRGHLSLRLAQNLAEPRRLFRRKEPLALVFLVPPHMRLLLLTGCRMSEIRDRLARTRAR